MPVVKSRINANSRALSLIVADVKKRFIIAD